VLVAVLIWGSLFLGLAIAALGHPGFYKAVTGRDTGSLNHDGW
jgi:hypothetical protein